VGDNLDKLKGHSDLKQDINRRDKWEQEYKGKETSRLNRRVEDIKKVISDPDVWNVNIASRNRMDEVELRLKKLEKIAHEPQDYKERCEEMEKRLDRIEKKFNEVIGALERMQKPKKHRRY